MIGLSLIFCVTVKKMLLVNDIGQGYNTTQFIDTNSQKMSVWFIKSDEICSLKSTFSIYMDFTVCIIKV